MLHTWSPRLFLVTACLMFIVGCSAETVLEPTPVPTALVEEPSPTLEPVNTLELFPYDASVLVFQEEEDRNAYQRVDLNQYNDFFQSFELSRIENFEWVKDPVEVATRLEAWPPSEPVCQEKQFYFIPSSDNLVILVFTAENCPDDAVSENKTRIEMHEEEGRWVVDWVGKMWKCGRGDYKFLKTDWHTTLCP